MSARPRLRVRRGMTLIELVVVLALLAILYSVVSVAIPMGASPPEERARTMLDARRSALRDGRVVSRSWNGDGRSLQVTAYPSGLVLADSGRGTFIASQEVAHGPR